MSGMNELEREIEESRARLDQTIDRIQDRLTVPNLVDEMIGNARRTPLSEVYDAALETVRRNPVPVLLVAAGVSWLLRRMAVDASRNVTLRRHTEAAADVPVLTTGADRIYDPDQSTRYPGGAASDKTRV